VIRHDAIRRRWQKRDRGFTLIEMVVVVAIVGILASAAYPVASLVSQRSRESELRIALRQIRDAIDAYKHATEDGRIAKSLEESGYPHNLEQLAQGVTDKTSANDKQIYFLRRIPRDPMNPDSSLSAAETWGKRSYASPPDSPQDGDDVFDVYSLSQKTGLDGVPYREW
jgi:general secretion pathway protein G